MITFVLQAPDGRYFTHDYEGKRGVVVHGITDELGFAGLFRFEVEDGRLVCHQKLPNGLWIARPVKIVLTEAGVEQPQKKQVQG